jgi:hypothetical protein
MIRAESRLAAVEISKLKEDLTALARRKSLGSNAGGSPQLAPNAQSAPTRPQGADALPPVADAAGAKGAARAHPVAKHVHRKQATSPVGAAARASGGAGEPEEVEAVALPDEEEDEEAENTTQPEDEEEEGTEGTTDSATVDDAVLNEDQKMQRLTRKDVQRHLRLEMRKSIEAVLRLSRDAIAELRRVKNPIVSVRLVLEAAAVTLGVQPYKCARGRRMGELDYWGPAQALLAKPHFVRLIITHYERRLPVEPAHLKVLSTYVSNPLLDPALVAKSSKAACVLWQWVLATYAYNMGRLVRPPSVHDSSDTSLSTDGSAQPRSYDVKSRIRKSNTEDFRSSDSRARSESREKGGQRDHFRALMRQRMKERRARSGARSGAGTATGSLTRRLNSHVSPSPVGRQPATQPNALASPSAASAATASAAGGNRSASVRDANGAFATSASLRSTKATSPSRRAGPLVPLRPTHDAEVADAQALDRGRSRTRLHPALSTGDVLQSGQVPEAPLADDALVESVRREQQQPRQAQLPPNPARARSAGPAKAARPRSLTKSGSAQAVGSSPQVDARAQTRHARARTDALEPVLESAPKGHDAERLRAPAEEWMQSRAMKVLSASTDPRRRQQQQHQQQQRVGRPLSGPLESAAARAAARVSDDLAANGDRPPSRQLTAQWLDEQYDLFGLPKAAERPKAAPSGARLQRAPSDAEALAPEQAPDSRRYRPRTATSGAQ